MLKYPRALQAKLVVRAAKIISDLPRGFVSVVLADEVEKFLKEHKCIPVGDTADKIINDLVENGFTPEIMDRARNLCPG